LGSNIRGWPEALVELVVDPDESILKAKPEHELALSALGGTLWYLRKCLIDVDLVTMKKFELYTPTTILQNLKVKLNTLF
jgi:DNA mismatch repair protein MSH6